MIPVRNVYYMLAYAFRALRSDGYKDLAAETFDNAADLLAAILTRGINQQVKRGLTGVYATREEVTPAPRGKIDVTASVKGLTIAGRKLTCSYDEFTHDAYLNRILKCAATLLATLPIDRERKRALRRALVYLQDVRTLDPRRIQWRQRYDRSTQTYRMLVSVCHLAVVGSLHSPEHGKLRLDEFIDDQQMSALYERFILEYYRQEHPSRVTANPTSVTWALDDNTSDMLPGMYTDVTLRGRGPEADRTLIIDAKYYGRNTQARFDRPKVHSGNLYQIYAYVKNEHENIRRRGETPAVSGMLLYARTDAVVQPDATYWMSGNRISVKALDLNVEFALISAQLDNILDQHFPADGNVAAVASYDCG